MNLESYLNRIRYHGPIEPTLDVLNAIHAAHLRAISYENLDIHLGTEVSLELTEIMDKIVHRQRGGWCFEMNSLLAWALEEIGFQVTLLGAAVGRQEGDDSTHLGHLVLRVELEQPYLADVGSGNGFLYPLPLVEGNYTQGFFQHELTANQLSKTSGDWWSYRNASDNFGFDFTLKPRTISEFAGQNHRLQTSPDSGFVKATVCKAFHGQEHTSLRGIVLKQISESGVVTRDLDSLVEYGELLTGTFGLGLDPSQIDILWQIAQAKHKEWVAAGRP